MVFKLYGAAAELFDASDQEILCESGARCGKTHAALVKAWYTATTYPGSRQLFARQTRVSLSTTVLPDWEEKILGPGHPAIGRAHRSNRTTYWFPNGSFIDLIGLENITRILSAEYDRIWVFQAEEVSLQDWETLTTRLSGTNTPYTQIVADVNPAGSRHWFLKRIREIRCLNPSCGAYAESIGICQVCGSGIAEKVMRQIEFRHQDNPLLFDHATGTWRPFGVHYLGNVLGRTSGPRRQRLLLHRWFSEEGQILEEFDTAIHLVTAELERLDDLSWNLNVKGWDRPVRLEWFGAGVDWGFDPNPGVIQVWGYDSLGRRFRVVEVYRFGWQIDQWAQVAEELWREFDIRYFACDPSRNDLIEMFNLRLGGRSGRSGPAIAIGADNTLRKQNPDLGGIDLMKWGLRAPDGIVRTFLVRDALRYGRDPELRDRELPTCTEDEIPDWVHDKRKGDDRILERPDPNCPDHGLDAWRYEQSEGWGKRLGRELQTGSPYAPGTIGYALRHAGGGKKIPRPGPQSPIPGLD